MFSCVWRYVFICFHRVTHQSVELVSLEGELQGWFNVRQARRILEYTWVISNIYLLYDVFIELMPTDAKSYGNIAENHFKWVQTQGKHTALEVCCCQLRSDEAATSRTEGRRVNPSNAWWMPQWKSNLHLPDVVGIWHLIGLLYASNPIHLQPCRSSLPRDRLQ